jgi:hypothetical protein
LIAKFFDSLVFKGIPKFQNSEYEVHQVASNEACNQNFSFIVLNTAELAAPQISSKNPRPLRQRRVTDGIFCFRPKLVFRYKKSKNVKIYNNFFLHVKTILSIFHKLKVKIQYPKFQLPKGGRTAVMTQISSYNGSGGA